MLSGSDVPFPKRSSPDGQRGSERLSALTVRSWLASVGGEGRRAQWTCSNGLITAYDGTPSKTTSTTTRASRLEGYLVRRKLALGTPAVDSSGVLPPHIREA